MYSGRDRRLIILELRVVGEALLVFPHNGGENAGRQDKQHCSGSEYEAYNTSYPMSEPNPFRDPLSDIPEMAASWTERLHLSTGSDKPKPQRQEVDDVRINTWSAYAPPPWGGAEALASTAHLSRYFEKHARRPTFQRTLPPAGPPGRSKAI